MGLFSSPSPFDADVEKVSDEKNTVEDWGLIMDLCDRIQGTPNGAKEALKSINKRLNHPDPHVVMQAITLLDACASNCGKSFHLELASREFENEFRKLLGKSHPKIQDKLRALIKKWAEGDFKSNPQLALIPALYNSLKREGMDFSGGADAAAAVAKKNHPPVSKDPNVVSSQQEEDDIAKAIQLSLQDNSKAKTVASTSSSSSLYPTASSLSSAAPASGGGPIKEQKKARALYDFEAAEDNELTFQTGEIVIIIDDSDANWWKGSNHRGEGLFPANFVTTDLEAETEKPRRRSVQFNDEVEIKTLVPEPQPVEINEERIDSVLGMLHEADPTSPELDPPNLGPSEEQVNGMGPLIDTELEIVDRRHAQLTRISTELVDALNLYHQLMRDMGPQPMYGGQAPPPYHASMAPPPNGYMPPGHYPPQNFQHPPQYPPQYPGMPQQGQPPAVANPPHQADQPDPAMFSSSAPPPTPPLADSNQMQMIQQPPPQQFQPYMMNGEMVGQPPQGVYLPPGGSGGTASTYPGQQIIQ